MIPVADGDVQLEKLLVKVGDPKAVDLKTSIAEEGQGQRTVLYHAVAEIYMYQSLFFHASNSIYLTLALYENAIWRARQC